MGKHIWTPKMVATLKREYPRVVDVRDLAAKLNMSYEKVAAKANNLNLKRHKSVARSVCSPVTETKQEVRFIKKHYKELSSHVIARNLGRSEHFVKECMKRHNLKCSKSVIQKRVKQSRFKKGQPSWNKGRRQVDTYSASQLKNIRAHWFKKGDRVWHERNIGDIDIVIDRTDDTMYYIIKTARRKWMPLHRYDWEKLYGPIKKGMILRAIDGDTLNCDPSNWKLITRSEHLKLNSGSIELADHFIAGIITKGDREMRKLIMQRPDLIENKRLILQIQRIIKKNNEQQYGRKRKRRRTVA